MEEKVDLYVSLQQILNKEYLHTLQTCVGWSWSMLVVKTYGKYKISYTDLSDEMAYANSADLDQTASEGGLIWIYTAFKPSILWNKCLKKKFRQKVIETLG